MGCLRGLRDFGYLSGVVCPQPSETTRIRNLTRSDSGWPTPQRCAWVPRQCAVGPIAQRLEQGTHNPLVTGSNPVGPTKPLPNLSQTSPKRHPQPMGASRRHCISPTDPPARDLHTPNMQPGRSFLRPGLSQNPARSTSLWSDSQGSFLIFTSRNCTTIGGPAWICSARIPSLAALADCWSTTSTVMRPLMKCMRWLPSATMR